MSGQGSRGTSTTSTLVVLHPVTMRCRRFPFHFHRNTKNSTTWWKQKRIFSSPSFSLPSPSEWVHPVLQHARRRTTPDHLLVDRFHVWHPYSSVISPSSPTLPISHAHGASLYLEQDQYGRCLELIDGMSSWWSAVWGYCHPILDSAMETQLRRMSHVMFGGLTHRPAVELSDLLRFATNSISSSSSRQRQNPFSAIFYADSGSVAVEVSLKMALQYWHGRAAPQKRKFLALRGGYHGDTLGAMSLGDTFDDSKHIFFHQEEDEQSHQRLFAARPPCDSSTRIWSQNTEGWTGCKGCVCKDLGEEEAMDRSLRQLEETFAKHAASLAAFILEPLVQGAGGMRFYSSKYLKRAQELCKKYEVLLICDEIATGFGRASGSKGKLFAFQEAGIEPDILCIGKALTGGYMTLAAVMTTDEVARGVSSIPSTASTCSSKQIHAALPLMHGPTFMANPLACSAAIASTNLMLKPSNLQELPDPKEEIIRSSIPLYESRVKTIEKRLQANLIDASSLPAVADIRVRGAIGVLEMKQPLNPAWVTQRCKDLGVWLRPFGCLLYTMPPYIVTDDELDKITTAMIIISGESHQFM